MPLVGVSPQIQVLVLTPGVRVQVPPRAPKARGALQNKAQKKAPDRSKRTWLVLLFALSCKCNETT